MQFKSVALLFGLATAASASTIQANPAVKHLAARAFNVDGSFAGLIFKRQGGCGAGYTPCGTGCSLGPCCNADAGLACRPGEVCSTIGGEMGCCPEGYVCDGIRSCQNAVGGYCTPGSVDNGVMCCDAAAPLCSTSSGVPYCAGAAPSTTVTANPYPTGGEFDSTTTTSFTTTSTLTLTVDTSSSVVPPDTGAPTDVTTEATTVTDVVVVPPPYTTQTLTEPDTTTSIPTAIIDTFTIPTTTGDVNIQTSTPTDLPTILPTDVTTDLLPTIEAPTSTLTSTEIVVVYPTGNGTGNATTTVSPPEATGAAGKFGVSGFALTIALGLAFLL